ncbi:hypothetical protein RBSWK_01944 [Rhodopirellula baltica SWK14]|uniref:Type I restriction modification DNA specificity domain-containing protein n=2 Tax=Rhodopirellula baltica TaxID=265606 RepID=L7CIF8_RHOBT|nr:hypothetical protein RBSWK_01944 [Rhodopirellula baltica SWK14]
MENGKAASVRGLMNGLGCGTTEFYVFRQRGALEQDYLFKFIRQESYRKLARAQMQSGVGQARVPKDFVLETTLPVPPLAEQSRIVSAIESLQERSSRARFLLSEVGPLIGQLRQSVLRDAFSGKLTADWRAEHLNVQPASELLSQVHEHDDGTKKRRRIKKKGTVPLPNDLFHELPESWAYATVDECLEQGFIIDYVDGNHGGLYPRKAEFGDEGIRFITAKQINDGVVDFESAPRLTEERAQQLQKGWARGGDVLLTHNATVGRVARTPKDMGTFLLGTSATYYRCNEAVLNSDYLYHVFCGPQWQGQLGSIMEQTTRNQVSIQKQGVFRVPVAPIEEQLEIARILDSAMAWLRSVESGLASMESSLTQLDQSILSKAFRGELVPQDPRDEPASELLARIRYQREEAAETKATNQRTKKTGSETTKRKAAMAKSRFDDDVKKQPYLATLLKESTEKLTPEELFDAADLPVTDFYKQLAWEIENGHISDDVKTLEAL